MTRLRRQQLRRRQCRDKLKFHSSAEAWHIAENLRKIDPGHEMDAYVCPWCNGWHVGHRIGHGRTDVAGTIVNLLRPEVDTPEIVRGNRRYADRERREIRALFREYARQDAEDELIPPYGNLGF